MNLAGSELSVPGVRLSRYVDPISSVEDGIWVNRFDHVSIGLGPLTISIIDDILGSSSFVFDSIAHYFVYYELVDVGFFIPLTVVDEDAYLSRLRPLKKSISFFNFPFCFHHDIPLDAQGVVLGLPCHAGSYTAGAANGPALLRKASRRHFWRTGNIDDAFTLDGAAHPAAELRWYDVGDMNLKGVTLATWLEYVESIVGGFPPNVIPLILGGDHSLSFASIKATKNKLQKPLCVIQFDHHLDIDLQGFSSGYNARYSKSIDHSNFVSHLHEFDPDIHFVHIGVNHYQCAGKGGRDVALKYLKGLGTQVSNLQMLNLSNERILKLIPPDHDVYISFDVDVISMLELRTTGNPAPLGISFGRAISLLVEVLDRYRVVGVDIMEFGYPDPFIDANSELEADRVAYVIAEILKHILPLDQKRNLYE
ncbi:arginase family protein [Pseudomonas sp. FP2196]|uniref:arginase family protein n=1 Tax=Pseudomonas sp. FP2196 TaxID=2954086 RepID=UPI002732F54E|nr:arginase family protein [Pseudomonas sp. FP2196]WLH37110.1 arginase family protein [Pseudomonas sp. FP2196]